MLANTTDVEVSSINVSNSPDWTLHFSSVTNLHVHHLNVLNPLEPNADGIDIDASQNVLVEDCYFSVGDDALCVKSGIDYFGRRYNRSARDIVFRRNVIGTGHGITIGSETSGGVHNVTFEDITMAKTGTGIRMKSERGRGGVVSGITYRRIDMQSIGSQCVQITLNYHAGLQPTNKSATPVFKDLLLEDVRCRSAKNSFLLDGLPEQSIEGLTLHNVTMDAGKVGKEAKCDYISCDAGKAGNDTSVLLPESRPELHDHVTLEDCASACYSTSGGGGDEGMEVMVAAGIEGGNHCFCGHANALSAPTARALARPISECQVAACPMTYKSQCACTGAPATERCGAPGRLLAYNFSCGHNNA
eukprot:g2031.t1